MVELENVDICVVGESRELLVELAFQATDVKKAVAVVWVVCEKGSLAQFGDAPHACLIKNKPTSRKTYV